MLEEKVRAAELLAAGQDAQLAKLSSKQIAALRFASDEEFGALLERAARENLPPKDIKAAVKTWRPDLLSHLTKAAAGDPGRTTGSPAADRRARTHAAGVPRLRRDDARPGVGSEARRRAVPESLAATLAEVERVLDDIGKVEVAIAEMKAALW